MSSPGQQRNTRSNKATSNGPTALSLDGVRQLVQSAKQEIISSITIQIQRIDDNLLRLCGRVDSIEAQFHLLQGEQKWLSKELEKMKTTATACGTLERSSNDNTENIIHEMEMRHRKRKYLVISGLKECNDGDLSARNNHDIKSVKNVLNAIKIDPVNITEISRLGKITPSRPRLLRLKCPNMKIRSEILKQSKNLRSNTSYRNVFINQDLTYVQQKRNKANRDQLKALAENGKQATIRHGKVILLDEVNDQLNRNQNFHAGF